MNRSRFWDRSRFEFDGEICLSNASADTAEQEQNELFIQSRREDPTIKEREHALQSLDLAYHKYKEIIRNLDEGLKVGFHPTHADVWL